MKYLKQIITATLLSVSVTACMAHNSDQQQEQEQKPPSQKNTVVLTTENPKANPEAEIVTEKTATFSAAQTSRVSRLLKALRNGEDILVNEVGINEVLSAIAKGAEGDSKTEIEAFISSPLPLLNNDTSYKNANLLYVFDNKVIEKDYLQSLSNFAVATSLEALNKKVNQLSNGKIKQAIKKISPNTKLILANAMSFNGQWQTAFKPKHTKNAAFTAVCNDKPKTAELPMMYGDIPAKLFNDNEIAAIALPFDKDYELIIALSEDKKSPQTSAEKATTWLYDNAGENMLKLLQAPTKTVKFSMPKINLQNQHKLLSVMKKLGISAAFSKNKANLSKVSKQLPLFVERFEQTINFSADESGAEATAVTTATVATRSVKMLENMAVDRAFSFAIIKSSGTPQVILAGEIKQLSACQEQ